MANFGRRSEDTSRGPRLVVLGPQAGEQAATPAAPPLAAAPAPAPAAPAAAGSGSPGGYSGWVHSTRAQLLPMIKERIPAEEADQLGRGSIAGRIATLIDEFIATEQLAVDPVDRRNLVTALTNDFMPKDGGKAGAHSDGLRGPIDSAKEQIQPKLLARLDVMAASALPREELGRQIAELVSEILIEEKLQLNSIEQRDLITKLLNDMLGLGPLEPLLDDDTITDIMVNGPSKVYVERGGKIELTGVTFRDHGHVMNIATRIVSRIGRRVDETVPLCDARLMDGSRVNIIIPPLAIDGPTISIRKFSKKRITLDVMSRQNNLSAQMATVLKIGGRSRLNILISGGTGSGKTTLLNAISQLIDPGDRIVTIEDAAELQLQQPHVIRLETRTANLEGDGEITMRDLLKNSLRMRPDRIILGEVRGAEAVDMLQAMNTGHEGSLGTIHANRPREALTRLENMVGLAGIHLPSKAVRTQIAAALDMIIQVSRMRDGIRRITHVMEVVGMEGDIITTQDLFMYEVEGEDSNGRLRGQYRYSGLRPHFMTKAAYFGLDKALQETLA